jgi:hypothetical protein
MKNNLISYLKQVEWLKTHLLGHGSNKETIEEYSKSTYQYRQQQISKGYWISAEILLEYPGFRDLPLLVC